MTFGGNSFSMAIISMVNKDLLNNKKKNNNNHNNNNNNNNNNKNSNNNNMARKYRVDVQPGIVSSHGEKDPLQPWLAILLKMVPR